MGAGHLIRDPERSRDREGAVVSGIGRSLSFAVAQKMRMLISRHLCAESQPAPNREWKERSFVARAPLCSVQNVVAMPSEERAAEGRPKGPLSAFAVPCWGRSGPFSSLGANDLPVMERSVPV
jgi:hypothetical protein